MFWSIGNMSNMYPSSPVKIPTSAYSVSMNLAISVNFWDCGPEAIGEDMHMYLKCYFSTQGRVIVKSIYSPVSCCNVEGQGSGVGGYFSFLMARYTQSKRHLWGSLDTGYVMRRSLLSFIAPETQGYVAVRNTAANIKKHSFANIEKLELQPLFSLWTRMLESHILMGQFIPMLLISSFIVPNGGLFSSIAENTWTKLSNVEPNQLMLSILGITSLVRTYGTIIPSVITWIFYEKYHEFVSFTRWQLYNFGKRPTLVSHRKSYLCILDWILAGPAGLLFYIVPMFHAQIMHLFTDELEYQVAVKPTVGKTAFATKETIV